PKKGTKPQSHREHRDTSPCSLWLCGLSIGGKLQHQFEVDGVRYRVVVIRRNLLESQGAVKCNCPFHACNGIEAHCRITDLSGLWNNVLGEFQAQPPGTKLGSYEQPFHLADSAAEWFKGDTPGWRPVQPA